MTRTILAAVTPAQPSTVLDHAVALASSMGAHLICVYVDPASFVVRERADGSVEHAPVDPDYDVDDLSRTTAALRERIRAAIEGHDVAWELRLLAGDVATALAGAGDATDAAMIVVGARRRGIGALLEDVLSGSIAVHLTQHQKRPVLVVPRPGDGTDG